MAASSSKKTNKAKPPRLALRAVEEGSAITGDFGRRRGAAQRAARYASAPHRAMQQARRPWSTENRRRGVRQVRTAMRLWMRADELTRERSRLAATRATRRRPGRSTPRASPACATGSPAVPTAAGRPRHQGAGILRHRRGGQVGAPHRRQVRTPNNSNCPRRERRGCSRVARRRAGAGAHRRRRRTPRRCPSAKPVLVFTGTMSSLANGFRLGSHHRRRGRASPRRCAPRCSAPLRPPGSMPSSTAR